MNPITIQSIQTGKVVVEGDPESRDISQRQWTSGFRKSPVTGPVVIGKEGVQGDEVADQVHHGGPEKAILCYAANHYVLWQQEHPELAFAAGGFGENFTLAEVTESDVCLGDEWLCGDVRLQISQPRQPCWKISRRWQTKTMTKEVTKTGRTGWYLRVLSPGELESGDQLTLVHRPNPSWSVARANDILFGREVDRMAVIELMNLPELSREWKEALA